MPIKQFYVLRERKFVMLLYVLKALVPFLFALDHTDYSRWLSVFIQDLLFLRYTNKPLYKEFKAGKFSVPSTQTKFSKIAFDQCLEHNNKKIKATNGYINIVNKNNEAFLRQLELVTPELQDYSLQDLKIKNR